MLHHLAASRRHGETEVAPHHMTHRCARSRSQRAARLIPWREAWPPLLLGLVEAWPPPLLGMAAAAAGLGGGVAAAAAGLGGGMAPVAAAGGGDRECACVLVTWIRYSFVKGSRSLFPGSALPPSQLHYDASSKTTPRVMMTRRSTGS